jgi:hypothetical protein
MMRRSVVLFSLSAMFVLSAHLANAQGAGPGQVPSSEMTNFMNNPGQDMGRFRDGGPDMTQRVADLVKTDKAALAKLIEFAKTANEDQRRAIARGLADAAKAYASQAGDPGFANQIQQAVANSGLPEFAKAYAEAAGDNGTASTGGGGGGGGPIAGGPTGGPNNGVFPTTNGVNTLAAGFSSPSVGGSSFTTTTTTTTTTQVSPF